MPAPARPADVVELRPERASLERIYFEVMGVTPSTEKKLPVTEVISSRMGSPLTMYVARPDDPRYAATSSKAPTRSRQSTAAVHATLGVRQKGRTRSSPQGSRGTPVDFRQHGAQRQSAGR